MTIDDELIYELIKPNKYGEVGKDALIVKIVGTRKINYKLEEPTRYWEIREITGSIPVRQEITQEAVKITPDITVTLLHEEGKKIAIELENDIQWDFQVSLRQVKKYKGEFPDTRVIIPDEYKRFAPFYKHEGFRVWLWKATRVWQCMRCGKITEKEGPLEPKCEKCKKHTRHRLIEVKNAEIEEYT